MYPSSPQSRPHPTGVRRVCGRICQPVPAPCRWPFWQIGQPPSGRAPLPGLGQQLWHLGKLLLPAIKMEIRRSWFRTIQSDTQMVWLWLRNFVSQTRHAWWGQHIIQNDSFRRFDFGLGTLIRRLTFKVRSAHDSEWFIQTGWLWLKYFVSWICTQDKDSAWFRMVHLYHESACKTDKVSAWFRTILY